MLGLLGGSHCLIMCGGIGAALGMGVEPSSRYRILALFQLGRVTGYSLLGGGLGAVFSLFSGQSEFALMALRVASGLLLVSMGCYLSNWWRGLLVLERLGQGLWRLVQPLTRSLLPVRRTHHALLIGLCWALLPCGLIYTALAWSASAGNWLQSALLMFCFGLGTVPVMFATGALGERVAALLRQQGLRNVAAIILVSFGIWTSYIALQPHHGSHTPDSQPGSHLHSTPSGTG